MVEKAKILIADDDPDFVEIVATRLQAEGYAIIKTYEGVRAVEAAHQKHPDLILLDWKMPAGKGDDVLTMLKNKADTKNIPVIILTGIYKAEIKKETLALGAEGFLRKPFEMEDLLVLIGETLARK